MASSFLISLENGWRNKPFDMGVNRWAIPFNSAAQKLDAMDLPEEAVVVLRELFEDIAAFQREAGRNGQ